MFPKILQRITAATAILLSASPAVSGQETIPASVVDSVAKPPQKRNIFDKIGDYFKESNQEKEPGKFDISFIGGPHYSKESQFGIGLLAAGVYRPTGHPEAPVSNVTLYSDFATVGSYLIGIRGNHFMKGERMRLDYKAYFYSIPTYFWGVGYEQGSNNDNKTKYKKRQAQFSVDFNYKVADYLYLGPILEFDYFSARKAHSLQPWEGYSLTTYSYGIGAVFTYDSRDNLTAPQRGWLLQLKSKGYPKFISQRPSFGITSIEACYYRGVWKGGILATRGYISMAHGKHIPWGLMPHVTGQTLRGYYERRFCDKNEAELMVELRQHVWRRNSVVVWTGVGEVFPSFDKLMMRRILPSFGVGYRWEFKKNINVRLDYGIGRFHESNFIFAINEAF